MDPASTTVAPLDPGKALWDEREILGATASRFRKLHELVGWQTDLTLHQWAQIFTSTLQFKPNLILELGRGRGNSTCVFAEASRILEDCRTVSICLSDNWTSLTEPRLRSFVAPEWFESLEIHQTDITRFPFEETIGDAERVLVFWDAHGFDVAECVLGGVMPIIGNRAHVVLMHDLSDSTDWPSGSDRYDGRRIWRRNDWSGPRVRLGRIDSAVEQSIAAIDFTSRNHVPLHAVEDALRRRFAEDAEGFRQLQDSIGEDLISIQGHWFWFSTMECEDEPTYPRFDPGELAQPIVTRWPFRLKLATRLFFKGVSSAKQEGNVLTFQMKDPPKP